MAMSLDLFSVDASLTSVLLVLSVPEFMKVVRLDRLEYDHPEVPGVLPAGQLVFRLTLIQ